VAQVLAKMFGQELTLKLKRKCAKISNLWQVRKKVQDNQSVYNVVFVMLSVTSVNTTKTTKPSRNKSQAKVASL
jgi:hypothetical protein